MAAEVFQKFHFPGRKFFPVDEQGHMDEEPLQGFLFVLERLQEVLGFGWKLKFAQEFFYDLVSSNVFNFS